MVTFFKTGQFIAMWLLVMFCKVETKVNNVFMILKQFLSINHKYGTSRDSNNNSNNVLVGEDFSMEKLSKYVVQVGNYTVRVLQTEDEIKSAQELLCHVYLEEDQWNWQEGNPTGYEVVHDGSRKHITDNFEKNSFWFGVYLHEELISCIRIIYRTNTSKLDIEGYKDSEKEIIQKILKIPRLVELQRYITKSQHRSTGVNSLMMNCLGQLFVAMSINVIATSHIAFFTRYGIGRVIDKQFDYGDGIHTKALFWSAEDIQNIVTLTAYGLKGLT